MEQILHCEFTFEVIVFVPYSSRYIVRKWNSKELNVGVLEEKFELPEYPKVTPTLIPEISIVDIRMYNTCSYSKNFCVFQLQGDTNHTAEQFYIILVVSSLKVFHNSYQVI